MAVLQIPGRTTELAIWRDTQRALAATIASNAVFAADAGGSFLAQAAGVSPIAFYVNAAQYSPRPTKMRMVASAVTNATAPGQTLTLGIYPFGTPIGGVGVMNPAFGSVVTGSTCAFNSTATGVNALNSGTMNVGKTDFLPASGSAVLTATAFTYTGKTATSLTGCGLHASTTGGEAILMALSQAGPEVVSTDFAIPSAGWYGLGVVASGAMAANSVVVFDARVEYRYV